MSKYLIGEMIAIDELNSAGIAHEAKMHGITHAKFLGAFQYMGRDGADNIIRFYSLFDSRGWNFRVADTCSDPVWEEPDVALFEQLIVDCDAKLLD